MKSKLRKGEIAEALFVAKALSLGMNVSKPFGQNCRYDFMVEIMGRASRVQVKSTWQWSVASGQWPGKRGARQYVVRAGGTTTRGARRYRASEVDYIAAYVGPVDGWYVIPVGRIPSAFTIVLPGQYACYREAWDLLCPRGTYVGDIKAMADPAAQSARSFAQERSG